MSYLDQITVGSTTYDLQDSGAQRETITGSGAPSTSTVGTVGLHYINTSATGHPYEYVCVSATGSTYTWVPIDSADAPVTSVNNKTGAVVLTASDVGAGTYSKPSGGIPKTDLASAVQTSLGKADTSYQKPSTGIPASDLADGVIPSVPTAYTNDPEDLGTASPGTSNSWARGDHVHAKPTYSKSDVGLGNVDNVRQYSASNPPPYPVTSVNGQTGAVSVAVPAASSTTPADLGTAAVGTGTTWARADHVHKMPSASDVGAVPNTTNIVNDVQYNSTQKAIRMSKNGLMSDVVTVSELKSDMDLKTSDLTNDSGFVDATGAAAAAPVQSVNGQTGAVTIVEDDKTWNDVQLLKQNITTSSDNSYVPLSTSISPKNMSFTPVKKTPTANVIAKYDDYSYLYSTTPSADDNSTKVATTAYVDNAIDNLPEPMVFKGSLGTGGTITTLPAASSSNTGFTYKVITNGTYNSQAAKVGDTFISDGTAWILIPSGDEPSGTVTSVGVSNATNGGLSISGSPITTSGTISIGHSNVLSSAQTTQAVYPIKIDKNGHISAYGSAVSIPSKTSDLTNDSGFVTSSQASSAAPVQSVNGQTGDVTIEESDENLKTTALGDSSAYVLLGPASSTAGNKYYTTGMSFASRSDEYTARLTIGQSGTGTGRRSGQLALYDQDKYCIVRKNSTTNSGYYVNLPESGGTLALTSEVPTKVSDLTNDSEFVDASGAADAAPVQSVNKRTGDAVVWLPYYVCDTAASTASKQATAQDDLPNFEVKAGTSIIVYFTKTNSVASPTLTLSNDTTNSSYPIKQYGTTAAGVTADTTAWNANSPVLLTCNGSAWVMNKGYNTNTTYTVTNVHCNTSASTASKAATGTYFSLEGNENKLFEITFRYTNTAHSKITLNIERTGEKDVWLDGSVTSATNYNIQAGHYICLYDVTNDCYQLYSNGRIKTDIIGTASGNYSSSNPPPYPVTSVNGKTGAVTVVEDDKTWGGWVLPTSHGNLSADVYVPTRKGTDSYLATATSSPSGYYIAKYDGDAYLKSTTPASSDNSTKVATTAFVKSALPAAATATPSDLGTAAVGTSTKYAKEDHVHNYPDIVHVGSSAPADTNIELWLDNSSGGNSVVSSVDGKTGTVTVLPSGGTTGQVLKKVSGTNYDVTWANESGSVTSVNGQTGDVEVSTIAVQDSAPTNGELVWIDTDDSGESITIPQIDDNSVSTNDTWSSSKIRDFIYPVGSIYMSVNSISPATIFGGTWEQIEDTFLLAAGSTYTAGATGGSATHQHTTGNHTLTVAEMPSHTHGVQGWRYGHNLKYDNTSLAYEKLSDAASTSTPILAAGGGGAHNHGNTGSSSNMPPYLAVYVWKRTA